MATIGSLDTNDIASTISSTAGNLGDKARDTFDNVSSKAGSFASKAQQGMMDAKDRAARTAGDLTRTSRAQITEHPLAAVGIGIGIGFILGRVLFR